jgi:CheY-like chemotaxis protein
VADDGLFRSGTSDSLRKLGYDVEDVADWDEALDTIESWQPHLVFLDLFAGRYKGAAAVSAIRQIKPDIRVVGMVGGPGQPASLSPDFAAHTGADGSLARPFGLNDLKAVTAACLSRPDGGGIAVSGDVMKSLT